MTPKPDLDLLPELARDMADRIGLRATVALIEAFGGDRPLYVPRRVNPDGAIARAIGLEAAELLSRHYCGERLSVPRAPYAMSMAARAEVLREVQAGKISKGTAARRLGLTIRWVRELCNRRQRDFAQMDLFAESVGGVTTDKNRSTEPPRTAP